MLSRYILSTNIYKRPFRDKNAPGGVKTIKCLKGESNMTSGAPFDFGMKPSGCLMYFSI